MQINQNADGTYSKTYSDTEIRLIQQLHLEILHRKSGDEDIASRVLGVQNRVKVLEDGSVSLSELQGQINAQGQLLELHTTRLEELETLAIVDAYSKAEVNALLIPWWVEEITHVFDTPSNEMFETSEFSEIVGGYVHYPHADVTERPGLHLRPHTMRRYMLGAFSAAPKTVQCYIHYADRCVVYLNNKVIATYQEDGGNFGRTAKSLLLTLESGWNKIQFLIASQSGNAGLVVTSNLVETATHLSPMHSIVGRISGDQIAPGTLDETHFSENMDVRVKKFTATSASGAAGFFGDPDSFGAIQIADGLISKKKDEPFILHGDIQLEGYILDKDGKIVDGNGGGGLTTAEREKLESIEWGAESNQFAFSYLKVADLPLPEGVTDPFYNVISAGLKMDTLRLSGDLGITYAIREIPDPEDNSKTIPELVIKNSPTLFKEQTFISVPDQNTFIVTTGRFQRGRGTVQVYIDGVRQGFNKFEEVDDVTVRTIERLKGNLTVTVVWQEGSPQFAKETIVSISNLPIAGRSTDGLMSRFMVADLYDHKHVMAEITDLTAFYGLTIQNGDVVERIPAVGLADIKLLAGDNVTLDKINDILKIGFTGPKIMEDFGIQVTGNPEVGYRIRNRHNYRGENGISVEQKEDTFFIRGPKYESGGGVGIRTLATGIYEFTNLMSLKNGGGLKVEGNAAEGFVITNNMRLTVDAVGGLKIEGNPVDGYRVINDMALSGSEAIEVTGDSRNGYKLRSKMRMRADDGIVVSGDPESGYHLRNTMRLRSGSGLQITGNASDGYVVINRMSLQHAQEGSVFVGGSAEDGYVITGLWPTIVGDNGSAVDSQGGGQYKIRNTGVLSLNGQAGIVEAVATINYQPQLGIEVWHDSDNRYFVKNTGVVRLVDGYGTDVKDLGDGVWQIDNTGIVGLIPQRGIEAVDSGNGLWSIYNTGVIQLVEGEGIDIASNGNGVYSVRNSGVLSWNGQTGHVVHVPPVLSVNGQTGDVNLDFPVKSVNGMIGDVLIEMPERFTKALGVPHSPIAKDEWVRTWGAWCQVERDTVSSMVNYLYFVRVPGSRKVVMRVDFGSDTGAGSVTVSILKDSGEVASAINQALFSQLPYPGHTFELDLDTLGVVEGEVFGLHVYMQPIGEDGYAKVKEAYVY